MSHYTKNSLLTASLVLIVCPLPSCGGGGGGGGAPLGPHATAASAAGTWDFWLTTTTPCQGVRPEPVGERNQVTVEIRDVTPAGTSPSSRTYEVEIPEFAADTTLAGEQTGDQLRITGATANAQFQFELTVTAGGLQGSRSGIVMANGTPRGFAENATAARIAGPVGRFLVGANGDGTLSGFSIDDATGVATYGPTFRSSAGSLIAVVAAPNGRHVFAADSSGSVHTLAIDEVTGIASEVAVTQVGGTAKALALDPAASHLYAARSSPGGVAQFAVDPTTGSLQQIAAPLATPDCTSIAVAPDGKLVFAVSHSTGRVHAFHRDPATGGLTAAAITSLVGEPTAIAFDRAGGHAFVTFGGLLANVYTYSVDPADGALSEVSVANAGNTPLAIVVGRTGSFAYVANANSDNVTVFAIDQSTASLTHQQNASLGSGPRQLAIDPQGEHLYVANHDSGEIGCFAIGTDGLLTPAGLVRARGPIHGVAVVAGRAPARAAARKLLLSDSLGVHVGEVAESSGTTLLTATNANTGTPVHAVVDPRTGIAYVADRANQTITSYPLVDPFGPGRIEVTRSDDQVLLLRVALEPTGQFLLVLDDRTNFGLNGRIFTYRIGPNGLGNFVGITSTGLNPENIAVHPAGRYVYSLNSYGDTITLFELDSSSGSLTQKQTYTPGQTGSNRGRPVQMAFHPDGRSAYVVLEDDKQIVRFAIDPGNGFLQSPQRVSTVGVNGDDRPRYVAMHPSGRFALVSLRGDSVATYRLASTGPATLIGVLGTSGIPGFLAMDPGGSFAFVSTGGSTSRIGFDSGDAPIGPNQTIGTGATDTRTASILSAIE